MVDDSPGSSRVLVSGVSSSRKIVMGSAPAQGKAALNLSKLNNAQSVFRIYDINDPYLPFAQQSHGSHLLSPERHTGRSH